MTGSPFSLSPETCQRSEPDAADAAAAKRGREYSKCFNEGSMTHRSETLVYAAFAGCVTKAEGFHGVTT